MLTINKTKFVKFLAIGTSVLALGCAEPPEKKQPGPRFSLDGQIVSGGAQLAGAQPLSLNALVARDWTQHLGGASHQMPNAPLAATPRMVASVDLGINARRPVYGASQPVIAGNNIYHYDAAGYLNAVTLGGQRLWRVPLIPNGESAGDGFGGGVAYENGVVYVATGYGEVVAVSAANGGVIWRYKQTAPLRTAPLVSNGRVIFISEGTQAVALNAANGAQVWRQYTAQADAVQRLSGGVPASQSGQAVLAYATGELQYVSASTGGISWNIASLGDQFYGSKSTLGDVAGDPVIAGNRIIAGTPSGVASVSLSGGVNWTNTVGTKGPLIVSGNSVFGMNDTEQLYRISLENGQTNWVKSLPSRGGNGGPFSPKIKHFDPRLVNGQIWVFDNRGNLRQFDATTGGLIALVDVPKLAQSPVFGNGAMVAMGENGRLLIFR